MVTERERTLLRAFVDTFPPLKFALQVNDCICYVFRSILHYIKLALKYIFNLIYNTVKQLLSTLFYYIPALDPTQTAVYQRLERKRPHTEPVPHHNHLVKRSITYYGGLILGALLFLFVYYVLIKHHSVTSLLIAFILMLIYMVALENSHNLRSIIMLCLPIMFTNRGRALVFCCMLSIMVANPVKNSQVNIDELHLSLNCCKQYLIIKTDKYVEQNVVQKVLKVEEIINNIVDKVKQFADELERKFEILINLALTVDRYIEISIQRLKEIVQVCNINSEKVYSDCIKRFGSVYKNCYRQLGSALGVACGILKPLDGLCDTVKLTEVMCALPQEVVRYLDDTVGAQLRLYYARIKNEFYVDIDVKHRYYYNETKSKSFRKVYQEVHFDVEQKFWYVHLVARVFNLVTLILVIWIVTTATLYQMHFLTELRYDNMYIDNYLKEIDERRKKRNEERKSLNKKAVDSSKSFAEDDKINSSVDIGKRRSASSEDSVTVDEQQAKERPLLFPLSGAHERKYLKPFSCRMNPEEMHKLQLASLVWSVIVGYIFFFVVLDFSLYKLIELLDNILKDVLFTSDLPLIDVSTGSGSKLVRYNRTYLGYLRDARKQKVANYTTHVLEPKRGSLMSLYRRLMDSIEESVPDDVDILDSLQQCLPKPSPPNFGAYKRLLSLALFTFAAVIVEAYALRTRHCIANLYYPVRAKRRAAYLYRKLLNEKPKYENPEQLAAEKDSGLLEVGLKILADRVKR